MKFITEMQLRDLYKTEPFTTYVLEQGTKITPGARQFLVDRRVNLVQAQCSDKESSTNHPTQAQGQKNWSVLRLRRRMASLDSLFLLIAAELLRSGEAILAEEVIALGKFFRNVIDAEREQLAPNKIEFWGWSEAEINDRCNNVEKLCDLSEFHVGLEKGKEIALLNHLRASLGEVEPALLETYWNEEQQVCLRQDLIDTVNLIINIICMMMWKSMGGQKWKR